MLGVGLVFLFFIFFKDHILVSLSIWDFGSDCEQLSFELVLTKEKA